MILRTQKELKNFLPMMFKPIDYDKDYTIQKEVDKEYKKIMLNNLIKLHR